MGSERSMKRYRLPATNPVKPISGDLSRGRPRDFEEWRTLRRWGKLPSWECTVIGYLLREVRLEAGLSQSALARILGVSQQAVACAERWHSNPTVDVLRRWAKACDARVEVGFARENTDSKPPRTGAKTAVVASDSE